MTIETLTAFFGWCTVLNMAVLTASTCVLMLGRKPVAKLHASLTGVDEAALPGAYFQYLAQYKIVTLTLNLVPYVALKIMASA